MSKLSLKEDKSPRVTSKGAEHKNYVPKPVKMASIKMGKNPTTMLGKGNNKKPAGNKPPMGEPKAADASPRMNSFHSK